MVFVITFGTSGPVVRSVKTIAQGDNNFVCVGLRKESEPCDKSGFSEGR